MRTSNSAGMLRWNVPTKFLTVVTWSRKLHGVRC